MNPLPPDPYLALGVPKTAQLSEIRSAHRKLVLKCHPDKVQDAALKAIKQDEFQKVQQAYELLSDETKRAQYDAQVKLFELRKEMGRGGPVPVGAGYNMYTAEPRTTTYRPKPTAQAAYARYESEEQKYTASRRSSSYETRPKTSSKDEVRTKRKEDERSEEKRRQAERDLKREKEKKSRDKDRRKASDDKPRYIERSESDSEDFRKTRSTQRFKVADIVVDMAAKLRREESRRAPDIVETAERHREKTRDRLDHAYRYMKAARGTDTLRSAKVPFAPDSPIIDTIEEEEETVRRSSGRTTRRSSAETPSASRRTQNSSRSRESPRLSSKDKKKSDPRMVDADIPIRSKPTLFSQKSAPPEVISREKPHRSRTVDDKYSSKGPPAPTTLPRASTFHEIPKTRSMPKQRPVYESESESESESDSPIYSKPANLPRERPVERPVMQKTSSYKIVRDINGQRAAERVHDLPDVYEAQRERSPSPRRTTNTYPRTSRPAASSRTQSQPFYASTQPIPRTLSPERERELPDVKTVRPGMRGTQSQYSRQAPAMYNEVKVEYSPKIGRESISYSDYARRSSDSEPQRFANYPAPNKAYVREEVRPGVRVS